MLMQAFDLELRLDESLQQLRDSMPRRGQPDEPLEVLTLEEFSSLFR